MGAESITLSDDRRTLCPAGASPWTLINSSKPPPPPAAAAKSPRCDKRSVCGPAHYSPKINTRTGQHRAAGKTQRNPRGGSNATRLEARLGKVNQKPRLALVEPLTSARPLDEHLHRVLINALTGVGRRWEAIEAYERLRDALEEEYAAEPEPETKALYRRLLTGGKPMPATIPHNLPEPTTSFIGRRRLLTELTAGLGRTRLLTLTGRGRCWQEPARSRAGPAGGRRHRLPGRCLACRASWRPGPEIVVSTVASALRVTLRNGRSPATAVAEQLGSRTLLLIMDNCEHLLEACSALIQEVLARCPEHQYRDHESRTAGASRGARLPRAIAGAAKRLRDRCPGALPAGSRTAVRRTRMAYCAFVQTEHKDRGSGSGDLPSA